MEGIFRKENEEGTSNQGAIALLKRKNILFLLFLVFILILVACDNSESSNEEEKQTTEQAEKTEKGDDTSTNKEKKKSTPSKESESVELDDSIPESEFTVGKSDKNFKDLTQSKPGKVRNDVTKRWKMIRIAESVDVNEYLVSYANEYFEEDDLVHVIINFNYKTTTMINDFGSYLDVRVHEYVDKEEHDAKKIGSGLLLGNYQIYKDNGDIIDVEKMGAE